MINFAVKGVVPMMISSKGRYALRVMLDMAEQQGDENIRLKDIAQRQDISRKYLESIMTELCKKELVQSSIGKVGGYRLVRSPSEYTVGEILKAVEGDLIPVACLAKDGKSVRETVPATHFRSGTGLQSRSTLMLTATR